MAPALSEKINRLPQIYQNIIMGLVTGGVVGYVVKFFFQRFGVSGIVLAVFIVIGAALGYLSGKERERYERLREEKILLEEDIDKIQRMLHRSESKYRLLVENVSDAIYLTTENGKFLLFNEATSLLSGYSREELKDMSLSRIQLESEMTQNHHRAWLDNGICRYEEQWRNKSGQALYLDVSAKWIKISKVQCILHVARDVVHRRDEFEEKWADDLVLFARNRLNESSRAVQVLYKKFIAPMNNTMDAMNREIKKQPAVDAKFSPFFMEWEKIRKALQLVVDKNNRNSDVAPTNWNLNEVLRQELFHLCLMAGTDEPLKQASFSHDVPLLYTSGSELSLILETLLQAACLSIPKTIKKGMIVASRMEEGLAVVQIQVSISNGFEYLLTQTVDPTVLKEQDDAGSRGMNALQRMLKPLRYELEVEHPEPGLLVRLKIPVEGTSESQPRGTANVSGAKDEGDKSLIV
jgi:PAS domain S-box-containing protein